MPTDSSGNYTLPPGYQAITGETVLASQHNPPLEDIATALTGRLSRNGSGGMLTNLSMGGFRITNQAAGVDATDSVNKGQLDAVAATAATLGLPSGMIAPFAMSTAPAGWLPCDGAAVSRTTHAALFAAIGTTWGAGNGTTTFNVPDLRGEFLRGHDAGRGVDPGRAFGAAQADLVKAHTHPASGTAAPSGAHTHTFTSNVAKAPVSAGQDMRVFFTTTSFGPGVETTTTDGTHEHTVTVTVSANEGAETRPRNVAILYCIKT